MITFLDTNNKAEFDETASVFSKGLMMEVPPGPAPKEVIYANLMKYKTMIHKNADEKINGLLTFEENEVAVSLFFLCALEQRKGIGRKLIMELAKYCTDSKRKIIYSNVSSIDEGAKEFYNRTGFVKTEDITSWNGLVLHTLIADPSEVLKRQKEGDFDR